MADITQIYRFKDKEAYINTLDSIMPENYYKERIISGGNKQKYLPIAFQEAIADMMFSEWSVIDEQYQVMVNEIVCTVKVVFVPDYPGAEEQFTTGSAAKPIQMQTGSKLTDFPAKKQINALEYCLPAARNAAKGCALEGLGNIFGRNIGRKLDKNTQLPENFTIREAKK
jgi:hypothetical protein